MTIKSRPNKTYLKWKYLKCRFLLGDQDRPLGGKKTQNSVFPVITQIYLYPWINLHGTGLKPEGPKCEHRIAADGLGTDNDLAKSKTQLQGTKLELGREIDPWVSAKHLELQR